MARVEPVNSPCGTSSLPQTLDFDLDSSVCLGQPFALVASSLHLRTPFIFQSEWNVGMVTWKTLSGTAQVLSKLRYQINQTKLHLLSTVFNQIFLHISRKYVSVLDEYVLDQ